MLSLVMVPMLLLASNNQADSLDLTLPETPFNYEQMKQDSVQIEAAEKKRLRFIKINNEPTKRTLRAYYILNAVDMTTSYVFTRNNPHIKEANFLLPEKPSAAEFILHKSVLTPIIAANLEEEQMVLTNWILAAVIIRNFYLYEEASKCTDFNYHHITGVNVSC